MFSWLIRKLFLVKEIKSRAGVLHFQRYRLFRAAGLALYIHRITASDEEEHGHDHPWPFRSLILRGAYKEAWAVSPYWGVIHTREVRAGQVVKHDRSDTHKLTLLTPVVWSLVFTSGGHADWGYQTEEGWIDHSTYRRWKNAKRQGIR